MRSAGQLIVIVGPSGAGKDTLIDWVARHAPEEHRLLVAQRAVTRENDGTEDLVSMTPQAFAEAQHKGAFCVTWDAHGLRYGIPASVAAHVATGGTAILNGSRRALPDIDGAFDAMTVVNLTVARHVLAQRLRARGRESGDEIARRLDRSAMEIDPRFTPINVDNSGPIDVAGRHILELLVTRA